MGAEGDEVPVVAMALLQAVAEGMRRSAMLMALRDGLRDGSCVCAAIVLRDAGRYTCVAAGVGTRCVGFDRAEDAVDPGLRVLDGHAEVMARRGFVAFLLEAAADLLAAGGRPPATHPFVECCAVAPATGGGAAPAVPRAAVRLRRGVDVCLVCSEVPCGAAAVHAGGGTGAHVLLRTPSGACLARRHHQPQSAGALADGRPATGEASCVSVHGHTVVAHRGGAADALANVTRTKPGKGKPNLCMSCSDKLLRWQVCGLQGEKLVRAVPAELGSPPRYAPGLSALYPEPIRLTAVAVATSGAGGTNDEAAAGVDRALNLRAEQLLACMPRDEPSAALLPYTRVATMSFTREAWVAAWDAVAARHAASPSASGGVGTDAFSLSMWLRRGGERPAAVVPEPRVGDKRPRAASAPEAAATEPAWTWEACEAAFNMKHGLPRGMTLARYAANREALRSWVATTLPAAPVAVARGSAPYGAPPHLAATVNLFALSRMWMAAMGWRVTSQCPAMELGWRQPCEEAVRRDRGAVRQHGQRLQYVAPSASPAFVRVSMAAVLQAQRGCRDDVTGEPRHDPPSADDGGWRLLWVEK